MKKILIIAYYWPPAGGPGVQRWLKFVKYLPEFQIQPIVYVPKNPNYPVVDDSLNREVSKSLQVIKKSIIEPHQLGSVVSKSEIQTMSTGIIADEENQNQFQKLMLYIRGNFFIPDARVLWVRPSIKYLSKFIVDKQIDTIISTGPPHSLHLIGEGLKAKFPKLKWIADFRDPWVNIDYHSQLKFTEFTQQKHQKLERRILQNADQIIVTSYKTKEEFLTKTNSPIEVITNGYDEVEQMEVDLNEAFTIAHTGSLLSARNPVNFWTALAELVSEDEHFKKFFELHLIGKVSKIVLETIERIGLKDYVYLDGYLSHSEAIKNMHQAQVLLLIEADNDLKSGIIPGKLFEYMMAKRPILAIGPKNWDVQKIITESNSGQVFNYSDKNELKTQIFTYFKSFLKGKLTVDSNDISQYSRRNLTQRLSQLIH